MIGFCRALLGAGLWSAALCAHAMPFDHRPVQPPQAPLVQAEVIHWWTSGGESAAVGQVAQAYRAAGGSWIDSAVAGGDQARAVTLNRIIGGDPPTAAQFNTSKQFLDIIEEGLLNPLDDLARRGHWDQMLPAPIVGVIKVRGHWYAAPLNVHMQTWIWYSKAAFARAGVKAAPRTMDELFADLDKLKAAGLIPLAHGGQGWQEMVLFSMVLANQGGHDLYLRVLRDRDPAAIGSDAFRRVLLTYKRLQGYVDPASPGRNWNDATALVIGAKAGIQIMGDWAKGEFSAAGQVPGREYGCLPGLGPDAPYLIQGDVLVFPKTADANVLRAQRLLADVVERPGVQVAFNQRKGSVPARLDADVSSLDACAREGMAILRDPRRAVGVSEVYLTPDQNGALQDVVTAYWHTAMPVARAQASIASALRY
jgi:glucose/mannose transport system substrate-binding protein